MWAEFAVTKGLIRLARAFQIKEGYVDEMFTLKQLSKGERRIRDCRIYVLGKGV